MQTSTVLSRVLIIDILARDGCAASVVARLAAPFLCCSTLFSSCVFAVKDYGESEHGEARDENAESDADYEALAVDDDLAALEVET